MSEEKIINEEVMNEDELDGVAGGTRDELRNDAERLRALGVLPQGGSTMKEIRSAFGKLGLGITCSLDKEDKNWYHVKDRSLNHEQIWNYIYSHI